MLLLKDKVLIKDIGCKIKCTGCVQMRAGCGVLGNWPSWNTEIVLLEDYQMNDSNIVFACGISGDVTIS